MKTTIKGLIKQHLIKVCKEKTALMRECIEVKPKKQFTKKKADEAAASIRKSLDQVHVDGIMQALAILFDAPELSRQVFPLEIFGVIILEKNVSQHGHVLGTPHIVTKNVKTSGCNRLFHTDGNIDVNWSFSILDEPRPATDAEIEYCINNLTEKQWIVITHSGSVLFAPLIAEAMASEVEVLPVNGDEAKESGDEIETNGRRITIGKE